MKLFSDHTLHLNPSASCRECMDSMKSLLAISRGGQGVLCAIPEQEVKLSLLPGCRGGTALLTCALLQCLACSEPGLTFSVALVILWVLQS